MNIIKSLNERKLLYLLLTCIFIFTLLRLFRKALLINTGHIDGVYQTFNILTRISAGDIAGSDFYPYLGLGPTFSLYPIFELLGGTVFASQFSANLVTTTFWLISLILIASFSPLRELSKAKLITFLVLIYIIFGLKASLPGNSLLVARSFAAIIAALSAYYFLLKSNKPVLYGISISVILLWSNDYGIPTAIAMLIVLFIHNFPSPLRKNTLITIGSLLIATPILIFIYTKGHITEYINFTKDVAADQFWYFAFYTRDANYYSLSDSLLFWFRKDSLLGSFLLLTSLPLLFLLLIDAIKNKSQNSIILLIIGLSTLGAGLLSEIGGHKSLHYYRSLFSTYPFLLLQTIHIAQHRWIWVHKKLYRINSLTRRMKSIPVNYLLTFLLGASLIGIGLESSKVFAMTKSATYIEALGGYMDDKNLAQVQITNNLLKQHGSKVKILSEYPAIPHAILGQKSELIANSVIHALGPTTRELYYSQINNIDFQYATTTNPEYSFWQRWSLFQNWRFYKYVILNFEPLHTTHELIFWRHSIRASTEEINLKTRCNIEHISPSRARIIVQGSKQDSLYEVQLNYRLLFQSTLVPIIGRNHLIRIKSSSLPKEIDNLFSIPPYTEYAEFPVILEKGIDNSFLIVADPEKRSTLRIDDCQIRFITENKEIISAIRD
ncbi:hypothetical protein [Kaarinaea lacus]